MHNQTYGFATMGRAASQRHRPSPLPRSSIIPTEKIYENSETVMIREKPAIPERPANLPVLRPTSKPVAGDFSPPGGDHEPLLRQTSISTIEKQQVSIIELGNGKADRPTSKKPPTGRDSSTERQLEQFLAHESGNNGHHPVDYVAGTLQQVPRSPRGNGSTAAGGDKIKRPQVPPPPSPRPKSGDASDSTNL